MHKQNDLVFKTSIKNIVRTISRRKHRGEGEGVVRENGGGGEGGERVLVWVNGSRPTVAAAWKVFSSSLFLRHAAFGLRLRSVCVLFVFVREKKRGK